METMEEKSPKCDLSGTIVRYEATISVGDQYHKAGEVYYLADWEVERVKKEGLSLEINGENLRKDLTIYHHYPVHLRRLTYATSLISVETLEGGDRSDPFLHNPGGIGMDWIDHYEGHGGPQN